MKYIDKENKDKIDIKNIRKLKLMEVKEVVKFDNGEAITVYQDVKENNKAMDVFGGEK